jgi:acyl-CoA oxidase
MGGAFSHLTYSITLSLTSYREKETRLREECVARVEHILGEGGRKLPYIYGEVTRTDLYHHGLHVGRSMLEDGVVHDHRKFDHLDVNHMLINASPFGLHVGMFIPTIELQADAEQRAYWLSLARSGQITGTYCQTELGHGTFLRRLETVARFDPKTDEFVIHSPTLTSTKYWPGGLSHSVSHAVVIARLIIHQKDYGVHSFMVQLRSFGDWKPLPGIELGDIGLKLGMNGNDNGYAIFHHVRIPRRNMVMGQAKVARDGTYTPPSEDGAKHSYSTMIYARAEIAHRVAFQLGKACTIAIRYSTVREQGNLSFSASDATEVPIMSFKSQHYRLLFLLAQAYAILFSARSCLKQYEAHRRQQEAGDNSMLPYLHIMSAGLKAYASQLSADGSEEARRCCGGHGYSVLSGFPDIVTTQASMPILEGENHVMYQQTARYLIKEAESVRKGSPVKRLKGLEYLWVGYEDLVTGRDRHCSATNDELLDCNSLLQIFRHRATRSIFECEAALRTSLESGLKPKAAWNRHMMRLIVAARHHVEYYTLESFIQHSSEIQDLGIQRVMQHVCRLYALATIESPYSIGSSSFFEDGYISSGQVKAIHEHTNTTLEAILPDAIGLTDAWNFSDASLASALGRKDGNVYEVLLEWTRQLPMNVHNRTTGGGVDAVAYEQHIRPLMAARSKL